MCNLVLIGLSLGPIYDNLKACAKLKEMWAASYHCSMMMSKLYDKLSDKLSEKATVIIPVKKMTMAEYGLYHDRLVFHCAAEKVNELEEIWKKQWDQEAEDFVGALSGLKDKVAALDQFKAFFYLKSAQIVCSKDDIDSNEACYKLLTQLDHLLDVEELNLDNQFMLKAWSNGGERCERCAQLPGLESQPVGDKYMWLCAICLHKLKLLESNNRTDIAHELLGFRSLSHIAAGKTWKEDEKEDEEIKNLKHQRERYAVFIQADGDHLGKAVRKNRQAAGEALYKFCSQIGNTIKNSIGGATIFAGGDDLLAVMPLVKIELSQVTTFMDVILKLSSDFKTHMQSKGLNDPTLSVGAHIFYFKHPMSLAREEVGRLLFVEAKSRRNAVSLNFLKHSGARRSGTLGLEFEGEAEQYAKLLKILAVYPFPRSWPYKVREHANTFELFSANEERVVNLLNHITRTADQKNTKAITALNEFFVYQFVFRRRSMDEILSFAGLGRFLATEVTQDA